MRSAGVKMLSLIAVGTCALAGCQSESRRAPYSDSPLLMSREPLIQNAATTPKTPPTAQGSVAQYRTPPTPPSVFKSPSPPAVLAAASKPSTAMADPTHESAIIPVASSAPAASDTKMPPESAMLVAEPTVRLPQAPKGQSSSVPAPLPMTIKNVRFDHAPDYSWLQGEFDCHYRGHKELRFRPASEDDAIGGKVRFVDDPRLAEFQSGDIVRVEGELVHDSNATGGYPRYIVRNIALVERRVK